MYSIRRRSRGAEQPLVPRWTGRAWTRKWLPLSSRPPPSTRRRPPTHEAASRSPWPTARGRGLFWPMPPNPQPTPLYSIGAYSTASHLPNFCARIALRGVRCESEKIGFALCIPQPPTLVETRGRNAPARLARDSRLTLVIRHTTCNNYHRTIRSMAYHYYYYNGLRTAFVRFCANQFPLFVQSIHLQTHTCQTHSSKCLP